MAATGSVAAQVIDVDFRDQHLKEIQQELPPGSSAITVLIEHERVAWVEAELDKFEDRLSHEAPSADMATKTEAADRHGTFDQIGRRHLPVRLRPA